MRVTIPKGHELFVVFWYNKSTSYQFVPIEDFPKLESRLPVGCRFHVLSESYDKLRWSPCKLNSNSEQEIKLHRHKYSLTNESILTNVEYGIEKKSSDFGKFFWRITNRKNFIKNIAISCLALGYNVKVTQKQLYVNEFKISRAFVRDFINDIKSYIIYNNLFPYDYMLFEKMLSNKILTTLIISKQLDLNDLAKDGILEVPVLLNKLLFFLYGKTYKIQSFADNNGKKERWGLDHLIKLAPRRQKKKIMYAGVGYDFCSFKGTPILFVNGITITYHRRSKGINNGENKISNSISP
jgi:hypothetical protein